MGSEWILGRLAEGAVEWIHLARDRDLWQGLVDAVMSLRVLVPQTSFVVQHEDTC
jgi:hypothetical protein